VCHTLSTHRGLTGCGAGSGPGAGRLLDRRIGSAASRDPEDPGRRRAQEGAESLADLVQRVQATRVAPVDREQQLLGSEYLIASCVCDRDHPEGFTRGELEEELQGETPPEEIADALGRLRAAGVVVRDGERLRPSRPALYLNELGALGF
jgi:hypothetical protein